MRYSGAHWASDLPVVVGNESAGTYVQVLYVLSRFVAIALDEDTCHPRVFLIRARSVVKAVVHILSFDVAHTY